MSLADRIASIEAMTAAERKAEWRRLMKSSPPPAFGAGLLARALAHHEQEKALGRLSAADLKRLRRSASISKEGTLGSPGAVRPGTWLSRNWRGEVHQVVVLDDGVDYRGRRFSSLSAVAREITGARWSGPRFFGLYSPRLGKMRAGQNG